MSRWPMVALGEICAPVDRPEVPIPGKAYPQVGVQLWGRGAYAREAIDGGATKYPVLNQVRAGDLIVNKIWARNGSVAVVPDALSGGYVSNEFPIFTPKEGVVEPGWLRYLTAWPCLWASFDDSSQGTSGKNRIKPAQILQTRVPLPALDIQQRLISKLDLLSAKSLQLVEYSRIIERDADDLLAREFADLIVDAPRRPLGQVAPLTRRPVDLQPGERYAEVGARSFGKGLFTKPDFDADAATWQKPVWIKAGDLVLSNIKAWEGAIAVAEDQHDGCIASHRYLTCVPDQAIASAAFLSYFLLTPEGLDAVGLASPGTADRNRTTNPKALQAIPVPLPSPSRQKSFADLQAKIKALKEAQAGQREQLDQLQQRALEDAFS